MPHPGIENPRGSSGDVPVRVEYLHEVWRAVVCDSSGVEALVGAWKAAQEAGKNFRLACVPDRTRTVLTITATDHLIPAYETVAEALADL